MVRRKSVYIIAEKQKIVEEAFSAPKTARKYHVQPVQIRNWKATLANVTGLDKSEPANTGAIGELWVSYKIAF